MRGLSVDLRERIIKRYKDVKDAKEVAAYYEVDVSSVYRYVALERKGKSLEAKLPPGRPSFLEQHDGLEAIVRRLVKANPEASLSSYTEAIEQEIGLKISNPSLCRILQKLELTRKKRQNNLKSEMNKHA